MQHSRPSLSLYVSVAAAVLAAAVSIATPVVSPEQVVIVTEQAWEAFNWASFDQDKIVSYGDFQYAVFWAADRVLSVARRSLRDNTVQVVRLDAYRLAENLAEAQQRNGHRNTVIGLSPRDGRLHLAWDHHNNDLNYTRSRPGLVTEPPERMCVNDFEPRQPIREDAPQRVTYPRFFNDHDDGLYFFYRSGGSGSGNSALFAYDQDAGLWRMISDCLLSLEGTYPDWDNSTSRNAYLHDLLFDAAGRLHITWVYREQSRSWASNHDLHYAYSDDRGRTWKNNNGALIADTVAGERITIDSPGIVVYEIPVYSWLMNQGAMALDSRNQPHVATYHMEEPFVPEVLRHDPPAEARERLRYFHYWRDPSGAWRRSQPLPMLSSSSRPMLVVAPDDTLILYFASPQGFMAHVAHPVDNWAEWRTLQLTGPEITANDASKPDRRLLRDRGVLSFTVDPRAQTPGRGFAFVDFHIHALLSAITDPGIARNPVEHKTYMALVGVDSCLRPLIRTRPRTVQIGVYAYGSNFFLYSG